MNRCWRMGTLSSGDKETLNEIQHRFYNAMRSCGRNFMDNSCLYGLFPYSSSHILSHDHLYTFTCSDALMTCMQTYTSLRLKLTWQTQGKENQLKHGLDELSRKPWRHVKVMHTINDTWATRQYEHDFICLLNLFVSTDFFFFFF